ncbi:MAG: DNA-directed RNA polymerase subunit H [Fervidicoccaceae archaeon]
MPSGSKFNVLDHRLVPKHERVPLHEVPRVLRELGVEPTQLPLIKASDPAARAVGARPGELVKIVRRGTTGGPIVVYRFVVVG